MSFKLEKKIILTGEIIAEAGEVPPSSEWPGEQDAEGIRSQAETSGEEEGVREEAH